MSLRDRLKSPLKKLINKFSGEYSAAETGIRVLAPEDQPTASAGDDVKVTRAKLNRPPGGA